HFFTEYVILKYLLPI
ncbi:stress response small protein YobI, partial [Escherichia coli]|nr:stress response small protein YobI [Escherichia coli]ELB7483374.1 stress response small protein YobI [Escherichia coli]EMC0657699.1 stress response small protein YobI [Escherichia coli]HBP8778920.1 stress response small protein YobI [Escherichia coli]HCQ4422882.1 stress response small protein YobI [Escherichia coli]